MTYIQRPLDASLTHHVTAHAGGELLCCPDASSRNALLQRIADLLRDGSVEVHAFALMDNHLHIMLTSTKDGSLAIFMNRLLSWHARWCNQSQGRKGIFWRARYASVLMTDEAHFISSHLYIEANPWRAQVVEHPRDNDWTSYQESALGLGPSFLVPHPIILSLGRTPKARRERYQALMEEYLSKGRRLRVKSLGKLVADPLAGLKIRMIDGE